MKKFKILYIAAVASLLAACANEEDGIGNSSPVAATIQANISKTVTRATVGNTWSENDAIGVYASSGVITKEDNKKYITKMGMVLLKQMEMTTSSISRTIKKQRLVHTILIASL